MMRIGTVALAALVLFSGHAYAGGQPGLGLQEMAGSYGRAIFLTHANDGTGRHFVLDQEGFVYVHTGMQVLTEPFVDISDWVTYGGERGLLGLAFDPDYATNGWFYLSYTGTTPAGTGGTGDSRLVAMQVDPDNPNRANIASASLLMSASQPASNHNGGWIAFGPDGYLYYALGDGGSGGDPWGVTGNGQNLGTVLGKILRLEVDGSAPYTIPAMNPFVGNGAADDRIWAYGLRNPWRPSFDRMTGDLYIADVGQLLYEEVSFQAAASTGGENYGWRVMEGFNCYDDSEAGGNPPCDDPGLTEPIHEYSHDFGCSITGGYVYRGSRIADLGGTYFFADYCTRRVWTFRYDTTLGKTEFVERTASIGPGANVFSFGEDETGELYFCTGGKITRIVDVRVTEADAILTDYALIDANGDGIIESGEANDAQIQPETLSFLDADSSGSLVVSEINARTGPRAVHSADSNGDGKIALSELLRVIQFFNIGGYACAAGPAASEDGFVAVASDGTRDLDCYPHASDHLNADGLVDLSEALRVIQLYNSAGYNYCPDADTEDGYCPVNF
jgi:glucose/arabinose dehydrogenase